MANWDVTTRFADAVVGRRIYPRTRRLANAAIGGGLLLDLAAARLVVARDGSLHASTTQCGFGPADSLLRAIASETGLDLGQLVWRAPVGVDDVITELVARGWWERAPRSPWRLRPRDRPTQLLAVPVHDLAAAELTRLLIALFDAATDIDDLEAEAASGDFGPATWLASPLIHQLVELRSWLIAVTTTHQSSG